MGILRRAQRLLERFGLRKRRYWIEPVEEVPHVPVPNIVYAIGNSSPWQAALICPCGCQHLIQLSPLRIPVEVVRRFHGKWSRILFAYR
jgi:hypothetical protein